MDELRLTLPRSLVHLESWFRVPWAILALEGDIPPQGCDGDTPNCISVSTNSRQPDLQPSKATIPGPDIRQGIFH